MPPLGSVLFPLATAGPLAGVLFLALIVEPGGGVAALAAQGPPGSSSAPAGAASAGPPQYVQGQGTSQPPSYTPEQIQELLARMQRANRAGPLTPSDPTAPVRSGPPGVPPSVPGPLPAPGLALWPAGSLPVPRYGPWPWDSSGGTADGDAPSAGPGGACMLDLRGDWAVAGRQLTPAPMDYAARLSVSQVGAQISVTQPADGLRGYGLCHGDRFALDIYQGERFLGTRDGWVSEGRVYVLWSVATAMGLEVWYR